MPEAIFVVNDPAAIGAMQALTDVGLRAGRDVALIGAGNIHYGDMLRVPLSTVSWSRTEMGELAARFLIRLIEGDTLDAKTRKIVLTPQIVMRDSAKLASKLKAIAKTAESATKRR